MVRVQQYLAPKWAVGYTMVALPGGLVLVALAHQYLFTPWHVALAWYSVLTYLTVAFTWSSIELPSRNAAVHGNNFFVVVAFVLVCIAALTTTQGQPFPTWAIVVGICAGVVGYSVSGFYAARNFLRWRRGWYDEPTDS